MSEGKILVTRSSMPPYEEYIEAIKPLWDTHWLTNMGEYHEKLESQLKEYLKVPEIMLTVNGHMALELAIQSFDFPVGSEIITTPFTFASTAHAIVRNHLNPIFCDIKLSDGTIDESKIEDLITERTAAIVPVHVYGHVCNVERIQKIANKNNLKVIYDAAHAFGVKYMDEGIGSFGDASIFSFHATKIYNTVEGGAVAYSDRNLHEKIHDLRNFGIRNEELIVEIGANAKMNEFSAIMGLCNLKYAEKMQEQRKAKFELYRCLLEDIKGIRMFDEQVNVTPNYAYFPILIEEEYKINRDELYETLKENGIFARKYFYPLISDQACYSEYNGSGLDNARELAGKVLTLPFYADLGEETIEKIASIVRGGKV